MENKLQTQTNMSVGFVEKMITAVESFEKAKELGQFIINSGFAPKHFEGKPEAVVLAIDAGRKLGFDWFQALQEGFIVNGIPGYKARALKALVMASGLCEKWETVFTGDLANETRAVVIRYKRKGSPEQERSYSTEMAKRAGLWGKKKKYNKNAQKWEEYEDAWCKHPEDMMEWKATSRVLNDFPDVCKGFKSVEELTDIAVVEEQTAIVVTDDGMKISPVAPESTAAHTAQVLDRVNDKPPVVKPSPTRKPRKEPEEAKVVSEDPALTPLGEFIESLNKMAPFAIGEKLKSELPWTLELFNRGLTKNVENCKKLLVAQFKGELEQFLTETGIEYKDLMPTTTESVEEEQTPVAEITVSIDFGATPRDMVKCAEIADWLEEKGVDAEVVANSQNKDVMEWLTYATEEEIKASLK